MTTRQSLTLIQMGADSRIPLDAAGYLRDLADPRLSASVERDRLNQLARFVPDLVADYRGSGYVVVTPRGLNWAGDSPVERCVSKSPDGGTMTMRAEDVTCEDRRKWNFSDETGTMQESEYQAGL